MWKCENGGMGKMRKWGSGDYDQHLQGIGCGLNCAKRRGGGWEGREADSADNGG